MDNIPAILPSDLHKKLLVIRNQEVLLDRDVAELYGVEVRVVNQAVKRNPEKFPEGYCFKLSPEEDSYLKSQIETSNIDEDISDLKSQIVISSSKSNWGGSRKPATAFTEKGLYMLATILKSPIATQATIGIVETFAQVRSLKQDVLRLHSEKDKNEQKKIMQRFSDVLSEIVMPDFDTTETESTIELNFVVAKFKHTIKRTRKSDEA